MIIEAAHFAAEMHAGQTRRVTSEPYINHPARVAGRVALLQFATDELVAIAYLHDVLEDCQNQIEGGLQRLKQLILEKFGEEVLRGCLALKNPSQGSPLSRAERKELDRASLKNLPLALRAVKLIDRSDNLADLLLDTNFSFVGLYVHESNLLADAIGDGLPELVQEVHDRAQLLREITKGRDASGRG